MNYLKIVMEKKAMCGLKLNTLYMYSADAAAMSLMYEIVIK